MTIAKAKVSCGVRELTGLSAPPKTLIHQVMKAKGAPRHFEDFIHVMFSDQVDGRHRSGTNLAKLITNEKLGRLQVTRPRKNPNSNNLIQTWMWSVNWKRVKEYTRDNPATVAKARTR